jgi:ATP-dependent DNA ligase
MLTKELSTLERVQPAFIEPMQVAPVRELPDGHLRHSSFVGLRDDKEARQVRREYLF